MLSATLKSRKIPDLAQIAKATEDHCHQREADHGNSLQITK